jgi:hypothetical protein
VLAPESATPDTATGSSGRSITAAPFLTAYLIPRAMAAGSVLATAGLDSSGSLLSSVTRTERILAAGATPMTPSALPLP